MGKPDFKGRIGTKLVTEKRIARMVRATVGRVNGNRALRDRFFRAMA
jgi:hypothetical protein